MYMAGLGGTERLWLYEYPGSKNCPPSLTNGCYNTGLRDGCGDPQQFETYEQLKAYAASRGEQLRQVSSAEEAMNLCKGITAPALQPATPLLAQVPAPGYQAATRTSSGAQILATGVATPVGPQIITLPGQTIVLPAESAQEAGSTTVETASSDYMPLIVGGGILAAVLLGKKRR